jgi:hypothetical protein
MGEKGWRTPREREISNKSEPMTRWEITVIGVGEFEIN